MTVVDLGAAPGGWSQVAAKRIGACEWQGQGGRDRSSGDAGDRRRRLSRSSIFLQHDAPARLIAMMEGRADVVMSDMAANTTGHRKTDQLRMVGLIETAAAFAAEVLKPGGTFLAKAFQSGADAELMVQLKRDFSSVRHVKPAASRQDSSERYLLATGFRGEKGQQDKPWSLLILPASVASSGEGRPKRSRPGGDVRPAPFLKTGQCGLLRWKWVQAPPGPSFATLTKCHPPHAARGGMRRRRRYVHPSR